ncbi:MAG TPA: DGQHR domain-containing protein [Steroidobacteraceae bacterium]|jgi:DGQHR domain-containing protein
MATKKKSKSGISQRYDALSFRQRGAAGHVLVMFVAPVKEILGFAEVGALSPSTRGPQREQKEARVQAIAKFLAANKSNTIPTAVILAFEKGRASFRNTGSQEVGVLSITAGSTAAATIVDGQHRLFGINEADPSMEVAVVALLDADELERAFQFLVINNKASKVPATHTKALLADMKGTSLALRLKSARLAFDVEGINDVDLVNSDRDSPFYKTIDWTTTPKANRMVQATAIELSLDYLAGLGVSEYEDRDVRRSVFLVMWKTIRTHWKSLWKKDSRLVSKVGIFCLTRFIADRITSWADSDDLDIQVTDLEQIEEHTRKIIQHMDPGFWTTPWAEKAQGGFDTNQGRDRVLQAITQLFRNGKREIPWYTDIDIIDRSIAKT